MVLNLPHCQFTDDRDQGEVLRHFMSHPEAAEAYFAVSNNFYELDDQAHFETTYAAYESAFELITTQLKDITDFAGMRVVERLSHRPTQHDPLSRGE